MNLNILKAVSKVSAKTEIRNLDVVIVKNKKAYATDSYSAIIANDDFNEEGQYKTKQIKAGVIENTKSENFEFPTDSVQNVFDTVKNKNSFSININAKYLREVLQAIEIIEKQYGKNTLVKISISEDETQPILVVSDNAKAVVLRARV